MFKDERTIKNMETGKRRCPMQKEKDYIKPRLMRAKQAALYLSISETSLWRLVGKGEIPSPIKNGSRCSLFETAWLDAYADRLVSGNGGEASCQA